MAYTGPQSSPYQRVQTIDLKLGDPSQAYQPYSQAYSDERDPNEKENRQRTGINLPHSRASCIWIRIGYVFVVFCLIGVWIYIMLMFAHNEVKAQRRNSRSDVQTHGNRTSDQIVIKGTLKLFDPVQQSLTVSWALYYVNTDNTTLRPMGDTPNASFPINIYRDVKVFPEDRLTDAELVEIQQLGIVRPFFRIDNVTLTPTGVLGQHPWDALDTSIDFTQAVEDNAWKQPLFGYPFDLWVGSIVFAASDREWADGINLTNSYAFPLDSAVLSDSTLNWRISLTSNNTCEWGTAFDGCELHIDFTGRRPMLVKFAAVLAVLVNWMSTIGIVLLTCEAVFLRRLHILSETDILGVCFTALFALPSVRAILPGAPEFGAVLDLVGVIPNMILVSICTTIVAISKLRTRRPRREE